MITDLKALSAEHRAARLKQQMDRLDAKLDKLAEQMLQAHYAQTELRQRMDALPSTLQ